LNVHKVTFQFILYMFRTSSLRTLTASICFLLSLYAAGQGFQVKGRVVDAETREPLAFVNILANDGPAGGATDIDGKFSIHATTPVRFLKISYVGYFPATVTVDPDVKEQLIRLQKKQIELAEVVIKPGINPAHRIIRNVLENRMLNDYEKMESFSYTTYEKTTFGPENDTLILPDSLASDTSMLWLRGMFEKQHLFLMESITERQFMYPDKNYNKVVASRVSGFGDPLFVFLMSQLQSTSFYQEVIKIADKDYINPISNGTFSKYYFEIQDTLIEPYPYDTTFIISFRPLMNTNFDGLKGVISISTNGFAIRNVIAQPSRVFSTMTIKIQQLYDFVQNEHWFPLQLNTDIIFQGAIGKGGIAIGVGSGFTDSTRRDMVGRGKSYISDIRLNPPMKRSQFGFVELDVQPNAYHMPETVWNQHRVDSLSARDKNTYHVIDSLGKANNFDRIGYKMDALISGKIPIGPLDLELDKIIRVNDYEGLRLGAGVHTNDKFSGFLQLGGYGAYGFKDKGFKYGGNARVIFDRLHEFSLGGRYRKDVDEAGINDPFQEGYNPLDPSRYRQILVSRMDRFEQHQVSIGRRLFRYATLEASLTRTLTQPQYNYRYVTGKSEGIQVTSSEFYSTEASLLVRYAYGEKFLSNSRSLVSMGTTYPVIWFSYSKGMNDLAGGEYNFNRFCLKVQKTFSFKYLGKTSISLLSGIIDRDVPYPYLFNGLSSYDAFSLYSPNSFSTMRMNEFAADRFASLFVSHDFGKLLFRSKYFNPQPVLVTGIAFGSLQHPENHLDLDVKGYEKGYFESGLLINKILNLGVSNIGIGAFYRYGYYSLPAWKENLALKLSIGFLF